MYRLITNLFNKYFTKELPLRRKGGGDKKKNLSFYNILPRTVHTNPTWPWGW